MPTGQSKKNPSLVFTRKFLTQGTRIASLVPSSRHLAAALSAGIDGSRPQTILELGAGTGAVTRVVADRMHRDSRLIAVEIDEEMSEILGGSVPEAEILRCDVAHITEMLNALEVESIDVFISCLPTPSLPRQVNHQVLECWRRFGRGCDFVQLTQIPLLYKKLYARMFKDVRFTFVARNFLPAGVYYCNDLKTDYQEFLPGPDKSMKPSAV